MFRNLVLIFFIFCTVFSVIGQNDDESENPAIGAVSEEDLPIEQEEDADLAINTEATGVSTGIGILDYLQMLFVLLFVLGLFYALYFFLKRMSSGNVAESNLINVLASQTIGGQKTLHIIELGNQYFLIASGDNSVSFLSEINDTETIDLIRMEKSQASLEPAKSFRKLFNMAVYGRRSEATLDTALNETSKNLQKQRDRLKKM